jgi:flagellar protein FliO/FliZ
VETVFVALRVALSLAAVLGLLWYVQRRVTRSGPAKRNASLVTVVGRQGIGQKASVVVVDIEGTRFVLGVTEQSVNVLHSTAAVVEPVETAPRLVATSPISTSSISTSSISTSSITEPSSVAFARSLTDATAHDPLEAPLEPVLAFRPRRDRNPGRAAKPGKLGGSILSPATWQQTAAVLRQGR